MNRLGVCSWSLQPAGPAELAAAVRGCGLAAVQLALDPLRTGQWQTEATIARLSDAGVVIASGMMACQGEDYSSLEAIRVTGGLYPDEHWPANLAAAKENAALARRLGLTLTTLHAGFLPEVSSGRSHAVMVDRVRQVADVFGNSGVSLALETGQETAETLAGLLGHLDHPALGVNFDPANMLLYGKGDPVAAVERLAPWVRQVHIKDALPTTLPGAWGTETPAGRGAVDWPAFLAVIQGLPLAVDLMIEREAGETRVADITAARRLLEQLMPHSTGTAHA